VEVAIDGGGGRGVGGRNAGRTRCQAMMMANSAGLARKRASGDFVWAEGESEVLRQALMEAEVTASADGLREFL